MKLKKDFFWELLLKSAKIPHNEQERLQQLRDLEILDSLEENVYDDITKIASIICQTPIALISLVDEKRQWFKSHHGLDARETPREYAFCAHAVYTGEILYVPDSQKDERFADNPLVTGDPNVKFYTGIPLKLSKNCTLGTLCVIDNDPRELSQDQIEALKCLARQVETHLSLRSRLKATDNENKKSEQELKDKKLELENRVMIERTQEAARIGSWQVDIATNTCTWSKMTYEIHEVDPSVGILVEDGINFYTEEYRPIITQMVEEGIAKQKGWDAELQIRTARGKIRWVRATGYPLISNGVLVRLEGTFQDIHEKKNWHKKCLKTSTNG